MAEKRRYTITVPDHVADAVESRAKPLSATPTEYASDVLRWWFGQGCPPVSHDEAALREKQAPSISDRIKPPSDNLSIWNLDPKNLYVLVDEPVRKFLAELGTPNLFAHGVEHDEVRMMVVYDNHPTHWLEFNFFKGGATPDQNGLALNAYPKSSTTRSEMLKKMKKQAKAMGSREPVDFSQIPMLEKQPANSQATAKSAASS